MKLFMITLLYLCSVDMKSYQKDVGNTLSDCKKEVRRPSCYGRLSRRSFRTLDGTCNNWRDTRLGAAFRPLKRLLPALYHDKRGLDTPRGFPTLSSPVVPTAQEVSDQLFKVLDKDSGNNGKVSNLHMTYGQFLDHDMDLSPNAGGCENPKCQPGSLKDFQYPCFPIKFSSTKDKGCMKFIRSFAVCQKGRKRQVRQQVNVLSAYIDGSHIYGISKKLAKRLRRNDGSGKLRLIKGGLLPPKPEATVPCVTRTGGCFLAGDGRVDEHVGLVGFHTIFVREHNRIAGQLKKINRHWKGERLYQTARKIVGAILQHITYEEYVPTFADLSRRRRYDVTVDPTISNAFSTAAFRFGHSQVKNSWAQLDKNFNFLKPNVPLRQTFNNNTLIFRDGIEPTFFGLVGNFSEEVDLKFAAGVAKKLFIPPKETGTANLAAINIQRGRDHGLPGYNEYRKFCRSKSEKYHHYHHLKIAKRFSDFKKEIPSAKVRLTLKKLYGSVDNHIDLFAAGLAEKHLPGKLVGPTFECILKDQFERLRDGDRLFYRNRGVFTRRQLREIKKISMAKILCNTLEGLVSIQKNVFKAFKSGQKRYECSSIPGIDLRKWRQPRWPFYGDEEAVKNEEFGMME